jgi:NAD(P)H-flavin reductase
LGFTTDLPMTFKAGQFISVVIPGAGPHGRDLRRAYSIASSPEAKPIELCVKLVEEGPGTNYLYKLKSGDTFRGFAPYGDFTFKPKHDRHVFFIATGTGIAPFRSMLHSDEYKAHRPETAVCVLGVRTEDEVLYEPELKGYPGLKWVPAVSRPSEAWTGYKGRLTDYMRTLPDFFPWLETEYYLCGNGDMIKEVKALLTEKGVTKDSIHQEKYY